MKRKKGLAGQRGEEEPYVWLPRLYSNFSLDFLPFLSTKKRLLKHEALSASFFGLYLSGDFLMTSVECTINDKNILIAESRAPGQEPPVTAFSFLLLWCLMRLSGSRGKGLIPTLKL